MPMMNIRKVRVTMIDRQMYMRMAVGLIPRHLFDMCVLMMFIMMVTVGVLYQPMVMLVRVQLSQMQPHPHRHECSSQPERERHRLTQHQDRERSA